MCQYCFLSFIGHPLWRKSGPVLVWSHCLCWLYLCSQYRELNVIYTTQYSTIQYNTGADEPMTRGKISLTRGINCCPYLFFYIFCPTGVSILWRIIEYILISAYRMYMNYRCYQITLGVQHICTNQEWWELSGCLWLGHRLLVAGGGRGGDREETWRWTKRFIILAINRWLRHPEKQISMPFPV